MPDSPRPEEKTGVRDALDIAIFLPNLAGGGAERIMVGLSKTFARSGKRVALVLANRTGPYLSIVDEAVELVSLNTASVTAAVLPLAQFLRKRRPTVLLSALAHANMTAIAARQLARVPTRVVVSERNTISQVIQSSRRPLVTLASHAMRLLYPHADGVIAISQGVADDLSKTISFPRERIDVVYNPVDVEVIAAACTRPLSHPWFTPGAPPVILSAGRMTPAKDHRTLLDAFAILRRDRDCRLVILGEGPMREDAEQYALKLGITEDVLMPGFQDNPFNWMRGARLFVLSSQHEGFGNVLVEAMACGTPIVSTDCPSGPAEILEDGKWGRLSPVGDATALAAAMREALDDNAAPDLGRRAAAFSMARAAEGYAKVMGVSL